MARDKVKLSPSRMGKLAKCELQFVKQYVLHEEPDFGPSPAATIGRCFHRAAEADLRHVVERLAAGDPREGADLPLEQLLDVADDAFEDARKGIETWTDPTDGSMRDQMGLKPEWELHEFPADDAKDVLLKIVVPAWLRDVAPNVMPAEVEKRVVLEFDCGDDLVAEMVTILDVVPADDHLTDHKSTGSNRYTTDGAAAIDLQLTAYDIAFRQLTGRVPKTLGWDTVRYVHRKPTKKEPDRDFYELSEVLHPRAKPRSDHDLAVFYDRVALDAERARALANDEVSPRPATVGESWWCTNKWCQRWRSCRFGKDER